MYFLTTVTYFVSVQRMQAENNAIELPSGIVEEEYAFAEELDELSVALWWKETQSCYEDGEEICWDVKLKEKLFASLKWFYDADEMVINLEVEVVKIDEGIPEEKILSEIYSLREGYKQNMTFDEVGKKWKLVLDSDICGECFSTCGCNDLPRARFNPLLFQYAKPAVKEVPIKTKGEEIVLNHLKNLLQNQTLADITFTLKGEVIKAHR